MTKGPLRASLTWFLTECEGSKELEEGPTEPRLRRERLEHGLPRLASSTSTWGPASHGLGTDSPVGWLLQGSTLLSVKTEAP